MTLGFGLWTLGFVTSAIIVAAGRGTRMGPDIDKLFLEVAGQPVVAHTWKRFDSAECIDEIVLVVRAGMERAFRDIGTTLALKTPFRFAEGGAERQDSVWNGLCAMTADAELVATHDGARPCISLELIEQTIRAAKDFGAAVAAQRVTDTIKQSDDGATISRTVDRSKLWSVQTPQAFRVSVIRQAISTARGRGLNLTDDTAACELIGQAVKLVESKQPNPKVTVPGDLPFIESLLRGP
ncbi:MAG TPA: 2-C-methyl-D-erythritol 4-phosphate cytidylyltransferase [Candidatus Limnocylindria bacterium]|nr:2-C-methyl-D-erythritol 4-phosphate cytidylyltransferase [Candidatus Limnocylindria bacterium]